MIGQRCFLFHPLLAQNNSTFVNLLYNPVLRMQYHGKAKLSYVYCVQLGNIYERIGDGVYTALVARQNDGIVVI